METLVRIACQNKHRRETRVPILEAALLCRTQTQFSAPKLASSIQHPASSIWHRHAITMLQVLAT